jgi:hypothetical protein
MITLKKTFLYIFAAAVITVPVIFVFNSYYYSDYETSLSSGIYIMDGPSELQAHHWSVPVVFDWDSDGKKDLLVGQNYIDEDKINHGYVLLFKNAGSDSSPLFNGAVRLQTCAGECRPINASAFG